MNKIDWFINDKKHFFSNYNLDFSEFKSGDLGDLQRIEFNNDSKGGTIEFWSSGYVMLHLVDYRSGNEMMNVMLEPSSNNDFDHYFNELLTLIG